ncbi:MAG: radical SAM protein, partial [Treponemataceae bacterium]|nr:radical SAM protein [Treponemataceae bacterium]
DNIVFMGMGEPLLNLPAVRKAVSILTDARGRALSARRITVSTSGIVRGIYDLAEHGPHVRLAVSLTSADEALRSELMPVSRDNPLPELRKAVARYAEQTGRRVTLEAALLGGRNTGEDAAEKMAEFACGLDVHINVIQLNPVDGLTFSEPSPAEIRSFMRALERRGLNVSLRTRRGRKIGGACGQLGKTLVPAK